MFKGFWKYDWTFETCVKILWIIFMNSFETRNFWYMYGMFLKLISKDWNNESGSNVLEIDWIMSEIIGDLWNVHVNFFWNMESH